MSFLILVSAVFFSDSNEESTIQENTGQYADFRQKYKEIPGKKAVLTVAFSKDNNYLITGGFDKQVHLWSSLNLQHKETFGGHTDFVFSAIMPSREQMISGSFDGSVRIWNTASKKAVLFQKNPFAKQIALDQEKGLLYVPFFDVDNALSFVKEIDITLLKLRRTLGPFDGGITCVNFNRLKNRRFLYLGTNDTKLTILNLDDEGKPSLRYKGNDALNDDLLAIHPFQNTKKLAMVMRRCIRFFELSPDGEKHFDFEFPTKRFLSCLISPDENMFITSSEDLQSNISELVGWDLNTKKKKALFYRGNEEVFCVACDTLVSRVIGGFSSGKTRVWELAIGQDGKGVGSRK